MSKLETPLTRRYLKQVGGRVVEEFPAVKGAESSGARLIDGIIILGEDPRLARPEEVEVTRKDFVVVQTKASRLGMSPMGQAVFSLTLMEAFSPASIRSVAICTAHDTFLEPLLEPFRVEVVVFDD